MFNNMRRYRRYPIFAKVEIRTKHEVDPSAVTAHVNSISEVGLGVYSPHPVEAGAEISIAIEFINVEGKKERDFIEGVIAWVRTEDDYFHLGILFDEELNYDKQPKLYLHFHRFVKDEA